MNSKTILLPLIAVLLCLALAGCTQRGEAPSQPQTSEQSMPGQEQVPEDVDTASSQDYAGDDQQESGTQDEAENSGTPGDGPVELPEGWALMDSTIYWDGMQVAEVELFDVPPAELEGQYADVDAAEDIALGGYSGRRLSVQREVEAGGMTGFENEIVYLLERNGGTVCVTFSPLRGMGGISEQREAFEVVLAALVMGMLQE